MTDNDRTAALRAKAEGMGLKFRKTAFGFSIISNHSSKGYKIWKFESCEMSVALDIAEALLGALDPDAVVVKVKPGTDSFGSCSCDFMDYDMGRCQLEADCPGPAQPGKKWVLVEVPECPS